MGVNRWLVSEWSWRPEKCHTRTRPFTIYCQNHVDGPRSSSPIVALVMFRFFWIFDFWQHLCRSCLFVWPPQRVNAALSRRHQGVKSQRFDSRGMNFLSGGTKRGGGERRRSWDGLVNTTKGQREAPARCNLFKLLLRTLLRQRCVSLRLKRSEDIDELRARWWMIAAVARVPLHQVFLVFLLPRSVFSSFCCKSTEGNWFHLCNAS